MTRLTISDSQDFYRDHGNELLADYRSIVSVIRQHRIETPLGNSNYLHALLLTRLMLEETSHQFRMLTGGSLDGFVTALNGSFREMLVRIRKNYIRGAVAPARVMIVNGATSTCPALELLRTEFSDVLKVVFATHENPQFPHFIVGDADMVRDERPHAALTRESDANTVEAEVCFYSPIKASLFASKFDAFWKVTKV